MKRILVCALLLCGLASLLCGCQSQPRATDPSSQTASQATESNGTGTKVYVTLS